MITLYVKTGCPYCAKVLAAFNELDIPFEEKNIADPGVVEELKAEGGKRQVPYLDDDNMTPYILDDDVAMYESDSIVNYLTKKYGKGTQAAGDKPENIRLHRDDDANLCEACE